MKDSSNKSQTPSFLLDDVLSVQAPTPSPQENLQVARNFENIQFYSLTTKFMQKLAKSAGKLFKNSADYDPTQVLITVDPQEGRHNYECMHKKVVYLIKRDSDYAGRDPLDIARSLSNKESIYAIIVKQDFLSAEYPASPPSISIDTKDAQIAAIRAKIIACANLKLRGNGGGSIYQAISKFLPKLPKSVNDNQAWLPISQLMPASSSAPMIETPPIVYPPMQNVGNNQPSMISPLMGFDGTRFFINSAAAPWAIYPHPYLGPFATQTPFQPVANFTPSEVVFPTPMNIENNQSNQNYENISKIETPSSIPPVIVNNDNNKELSLPPVEITPAPMVTKPASKKETSKQSSTKDSNKKSKSATNAKNKKTTAALSIVELAVSAGKPETNDNNNASLKRKEQVTEPTEETSLTKKTKTTESSVVDSWSLFATFKPTSSSADQHLAVYKSCYQSVFVNHQILANIEQKNEKGFYIITTLMQAVIDNDNIVFDLELNRIQKEQNKWPALNLPVLKSRSNQEIDLFPLNEKPISALTIACMLGRAKMAIKLLKAGALDYKSSLLIAIKYAHVGLIQFVHIVCKKANIANPFSILQTADLKSAFSTMPLDNISQVLYVLCKLEFFADKNRLSTVANILAQRSDWVGLPKLMGPQTHVTTFFSMPKEERRVIKAAYNELSAAIDENVKQNIQAHSELLFGLAQKL